MLSCCLLASVVFDEKLFIIALYVMNHFAPLDSLTMVYLGMSLFEFIILGAHCES